MNSDNANKSDLGKIEQQILMDLLDAYERKSSSRRTIIKAEKFQAYDLNHFDRKKLFIQSIRSLADKKFIKYEWKKYERNNLLDRIILIEDDIELIYELLGRKTKEQRIQAYIDELNDYRHDIECDWIENFLDAEENNIRSKSYWTAIWPDSIKERKEFVMLLKSVIDRQDKSLRYLSIRLFGESKKLEKQYKHKIISVARKYIPLSLDDDEILEYLGIMLNPTEVLVYGGLEYTLNGKFISTSDYVYGTSINRKTIENMTELSLDVDRVLTIENKATYYEYIKTSPQNEFVIYLGGFFGSTASTFLNLLSRLEGVEFYHWSDIDLGGFRIFRYLLQTVDKNVHPFGMSPELYKKYLEIYPETDNITEKQLDEIADMLRMDELEELHDTMRCVLDYKKRIEQECIDIEDLVIF